MTFAPDAVTAWQSIIAHDLLRFAPEGVLVASILSFLVLRMIDGRGRIALSVVAFAGAATALLLWTAAYFGVMQATVEYGSAFDGQLMLDPFANLLRGLLLVFLFLAVILTQLTSFPARDDAADFYVLFFGAMLGLMLMTTANHLMMVIVAIEMASLPGYALAGFNKGSKRAAEGSLKYLLYGAAAAAMMVYGVSLLTAHFGTGSIPKIMSILKETPLTTTAPMVIVGGMLLLFGLLFKLSAVPFHAWLPDVFEGASAEVAVLVAVASKIAAAGLLVRVVVGVASADAEFTRMWFAPLLCLLAMLTMTVGNVLAYQQTNLKRLLGASTIAHAGYLLAAIATVGPKMPSTVLMYLAGYLFMNLGVFALAAFLRAGGRADDVSSLRGLVRTSPGLAIGFVVCVASLLGLPPFAGFIGKFQVFRDVYTVAAAASEGQKLLYFVLFVVALLNTLLSAGYYLKLIRSVFTEATMDSEQAPSPSFGSALYMLCLAVVLTAMGLLWELLATAVRAAAISSSP